MEDGSEAEEAWHEFPNPAEAIREAKVAAALAPDFRPVHETALLRLRWDCGTFD